MNLQEFYHQGITEDNAKYFGTHGKFRYLRNTLRDLEWIFPLRSCGEIFRKLNINSPV